MIITFGTQKGGVGKTTLAVAFANYLALFKNREVKVFDFDFQKSFYQKWKDDEMLPLPKLYDVVLLDEEELKKLTDNMDKLTEMQFSEQIYIFDLAGILNENYTEILRSSDFIIIPFEYSEVALKSTVMFYHFLGEYVESQATRIFIRNRIDKNYNYKNQEEQDKEFRKQGILLQNSIYKRNDLQFITTRKLNYSIKNAVQEPFEEIINIINETLQTTI